MFLGQHSSLLQDDYRLSLPLKFREIFADGIYLTKGFDHNLLILTTGAFETISQHISSLNITDPIARLLMRLIFGSACQLEIEMKNQFQLPKDMVEFAGLKEKVLIVGQGDYCEIWSEEKWLEQESRLFNIDENSKRFSGLNVTTRQSEFLALK